MQINGNATFQGGFEDVPNFTDSEVTGDLSVSGEFEVVLETSGTFSARNVSVTGSIIGEANFEGTSATVNGNIRVTGGVGAEIAVSTSAISEFKGTTELNGGKLQNAFNVANSNFRADKDIDLNMRSGSTQVQIGDGAAPISLLGNLTINAGASSDNVLLENVQVAKATQIALGAGADQLSIEDGSTFAGAFTADTGAGDDTVAIAQNTGASGPVTFSARTRITTGAGNDTLLLGKGAGGDANSKAVFAGAGSKIDGGAGFNTFDDGAPMNYTGLVFGTSIVNFTDPNP